MLEMSAASGYAMAHDDKYRARRLAQHAARRQAELAEPGEPGKPNVAGWQKLAQVLAQTGSVQRGGERLVQ